MAEIKQGMKIEEKELLAMGAELVLDDFGGAKVFSLPGSSIYRIYWDSKSTEITNLLYKSDG